tara:strand:+ start:2377 stop:2613 length:237 start_codon:yes stop_codon:yes gene_type:complete
VYVVVKIVERESIPTKTLKIAKRILRFLLMNLEKIFFFFVSVLNVKKTFLVFRVNSLIKQCSTEKILEKERRLGKIFF